MVYPARRSAYKVQKTNCEQLLVRTGRGVVGNSKLERNTLSSLLSWRYAGEHLTITHCCLPIAWVLRTDKATVVHYVTTALVWGVN